MSRLAALRCQWDLMCDFVCWFIAGVDAETRVCSYLDNKQTLNAEKRCVWVLLEQIIYRRLYIRVYNQILGRTSCPRLVCLVRLCWWTLHRFTSRSTSDGSCIWRSEYWKSEMVFFWAHGSVTLNAADIKVSPREEVWVLGSGCCARLILCVLTVSYWIWWDRWFHCEIWQTESRLKACKTADSCINAACTCRWICSNYEMTTEVSFIKCS